MSSSFFSDLVLSIMMVSVSVGVEAFFSEAPITAFLFLAALAQLSAGGVLLFLLLLLLFVGGGGGDGCRLALSPCFSLSGGGGELLVIAFGDVILALVLDMVLGVGIVGGVERAVDTIHFAENCPRQGGHRVGHLVSKIHDRLLQILDFVCQCFTLFQPISFI